jgi:hypothetical protein
MVLIAYPLCSGGGHAGRSALIIGTAHPSSHEAFALNRSLAGNGTAVVLMQPDLFHDWDTGQPSSASRAHRTDKIVPHVQVALSSAVVR